jgi:pimeloyl-ACP methyl ester carboxylesterase
LQHSPSSLIVADNQARLAEYRRWLDEGRQILLFDPTGDGCVAEVFGNLEAADTIAVVVPGMSNDLSNFSTSDGGFRLNAANLFAAASGGQTATVAWLGYDTPDGADAASRSAAAAGAPCLARFLRGIDPAADRRVTVVAHSYGSVLSGIAAADGIEADNLVFVGSPGTTLDDATEATLRAGGVVWSALADGDPIGLGVDPLESYRWWWGLHPLIPVVGMFEALRRRDDLWHGVNPVSSQFGATRIATEGSSGHSGYFGAGTLENLAAIVEGRYGSVVLAD